MFLTKCERLEILSLLSRTLGAELDRAAWLELLNGQCRGHFWVVVDGAELQTTLIKVHNDLVALFMVKPVDGGDVDCAQTVAVLRPEERVLLLGLPNTAVPMPAAKSELETWVVGMHDAGQPKRHIQVCFHDDMQEALAAVGVQLEGLLDRLARRAMIS